MLAFLAFSGLQCVQDLITTPPNVTYVFTVTPAYADSALVNVGDTIQPITGTLTADGRPAGFTLGCSVAAGDAVVKVDTVAGCRLIVTGRGSTRVVVRPRSVSLPVDTLVDSVRVVAVVPRIALAATPPEDTLYSLLDTKTLQATAQTRGHVTIPGAPITWRLVSGANFVTLVNAATGTVRADSNGVAVLEATADTAHALRTVRVRQRATAMALTAPQVRLRAIGQAWSVGATLKDARTNSVYDRSVTWTSRNTNVVRVTAGQLTAVGEGATYVVASYSEPAIGAPTLADSVAVIVQVARLQVTAGTPQTDTVGAPVGVPLAVRLVDGSGTAITDVGVPVVFKAGTGGGKFGTADSVVVTTVAPGVASATPTLGNAAGTATFTAYVPGAPGSPVTFTVTCVPDAPTAIVVDSGAAQSDTVLHTLANGLVVQVRDRFANPVPGATVRFVVTAGGGKVATNQDSVVLTTDANGRARTTHTLGSTAGAHTVTVRAAFGTPVTFTATAAPARAKRLRFTQQPANVVAGGSFAAAPVVQVQDSLGNVAPSATPSVALALATNTAGATLGGTATASATAGVATFSALTIGKAATALRIVATATGLVPDTSVAFNVTAGTAQRIAFLVQPAGSRTGRPIAPAVQVGVLDALGNVVTGAQLDVTISIGTIPAGGSSSVFGSPTVATVQGVATFTDLGVQNIAAGYRLRASAPGLAAVTSDLFSVVGAPATFTVVSGQDRTATAGTALDSAFVVAVKDAAGNGVPGDTVIFKVTAGGGKFGGIDSAIVVTGSDGRASAQLTLGASVGTNTATARSASLAGTTLTFNATAISGTLHLAFGTQPSRVNLGSSISPAIRVEVRDAANNLVTSATPTVTLAVTSGTGRAGASLSGTVSVAAVNGVATFTGIGVSRAGTGYTLTATAGTITAVTSTTFEVVGVPASMQTYSGRDQNGTPGTALPLPLVAAVFDANGDPVAADTVVFKIVSPATGGSLGGGLAAHDSVVVYTDGLGRASVTLTLPNAVGAVGVSAWSTRSPATSVYFAASVTASGRLLEFVSQPSSASAGTVIAPAFQVRVRDAGGATDATATTLITLSITSGTGTSGAVASGTVSVAAVSGVATFSNVKVNLVGTGYTLTASAGGVTSATSTAFNVTAGAAHHLEFASPGSATAGAPFATALQVRVVDAGGNVVASAANAVTIAITSGTGPAGAHLRGTATVSASSGVATFGGVSIDSAGTGYTLTAAASGLVSATSAAFAVQPAPAVRLAFQSAIPNGTAGVTLNPVVVLVRDSLGNTVTISSIVVALGLQSGPSGATLLGTTQVAAVNGVATFGDLRLRKSAVNAGGMVGYAFGASEVVWSGLTGSTSNVFDILTAPASQLVFLQQPTDAAPGAVISPAVQVAAQDSVGNTIPAFTSGIVLSIATWTGTAGATLGGTTSVSAVNGVATFSDLSIATAGNNYALVASAGGLPLFVSASFSVLSAAQSRLVFTAAPTSIVPGQRFGVTVTVKDGSGTTITSATDAVTLSITSGWGNAGAALRGTRTVNAVAGVATFSGLSIDSAGVYQLTATSAALASGTSGNLINNAGPPTQLHFAVQPNSRTAGSVFTPAISVQLRDSLNNFASSVDVAVTIGLNPASNPGAATLAGTTTRTTNAGIATFADLSVAKVGTGYELMASTGTPGISSAVSTSFSIAVGSVATVVVTPAGATLQSGATRAFTAEARDVAGNVVTGAAFTWSSLSTGVATVSATGVATAVGAGQAAVRATSGSATGYGLVTVAAPGLTPVNLWARTTTADATAYSDATWGTSASTVFAVGYGGRIQRFDGSRWTVMSSGTESFLHAVTGTSATDVFAVGGDDAIVHYDGTNWSVMSVPDRRNDALIGVWAASPTDVFAVGYGGQILHYDGANWSRMSSGSTQNLSGVWGTSPSNVFVTGQNGTILRFDGHAWAPMASGVTGEIPAVWGTSENEVFAADPDGNRLLRYDGSSWTVAVSSYWAQATFMWGSSGSDVYLVPYCNDCRVQRFDGTTAAAMPNTAWPEYSRGVWGSPDGAVFIAGSGGMIQHGYRGATVAVSPGTPTLQTLNRTYLFTATARTATGAEVTGVSYTWSSSNTGVATVNATTGVVTAVANGTATITATAPGGASGSTTVTVQQVPFSLTIAPTGVSLNPGNTYQFSAAAYDSNSVAVPSATIVWSSTSYAIASVDANGLVTAGSTPGQAIIIAGVLGVVIEQATVTVRLLNAQPVNLWRRLASPTTLQFTAVHGTPWSVGNDVWVTDSTGTLHHLREGVWTSFASTAPALFDVFSIGQTETFVAGRDGWLRYFNGSAFTTLTTGVQNYLRAVWGGGSWVAYVVGSGGVAFRVRHGAKDALTSNTTNDLYGVYGFGTSSSVYAVGQNGTILQFNGGTDWSPMTSGTGQTLRSIWGPMEPSQFAVGDNGTILRFLSPTWSAMESNTSAYLTSVWGTYDRDVYAVGSAGTILRYDGSAWVPMTSGVSAGAVLRGIWGNQAEMIVVGDSGIVLQGLRGATVSVAPVTLTAVGATRQLTATARDAQSNVLTGVVGYAWSSDNLGVATVDAVTGVVTAVANGTATITATGPGGASGTGTVTVAQAAKTLTMNQVGYYLYVTGGTFTPTIEVRDSLNHLVPSPVVSWTSANPNVATVNPTTGEIAAVATGEVTIAATSGAATGYLLVAVSRSGLPAVNLWAQVATGTTQALRAIWGTSPTNLYAGGGNIFRYTGSSWTSQVSGSGLNYRSVWGAAPTDVWAVGPSGTIQHFDGSAWTTQVSGVSVQFYGVWGRSPRDILAVGDGGTILHYDGTAWTPQVSGVTETLRAVWGVQGEAWAVGGAGTILHQASGTTTWATQASGTVQPLYAIRGFDCCHIRITGEAGTILSYNGSAWSAQIGGGTQTLTGVAGSGESDLYAVSWGDPGTGVNGWILQWNGSAWSYIEAPYAGLTGAFALGSDVYVTALTGGLLRGYRGATVTVTPATPTVVAGATRQLTATARDASTSPISGVTFTWTSSVPSVATVSSTGLVTAVAAGTTTITATASGWAADSTTVTVTPSPHALSLDGATRYVEVPSSGSFDTGTLTLEAWVRLTSDVGPGQVRIITRQQQGQVFPAWGLDIFGSGYVGSTGNELAFHARHSTSSDVYRSGYNLVKGRWYHVAATNDGTTASMYVDGALVYQHAADGTVASPTGVAIEIGAALNGTDYFVPGDLDEVRFWNVARTAQQISDSRSDTLPTGATGLVGYWRFDEASGAATSDYSGNGHTGTLVNGPARIAEGWRTPAPVGLVVVSPAGASITGVGSTATLTASVRDTFNVALSGRTVTWSSLNPNVATVNPSTGVVTAVGAGQVTVRATSGSATGYALVTVATPALAATPVNLWAPMVSGPSTFSPGAWGTSATDIWVTDGPNVKRYDGTQWTTQSIGWFAGIWGSSASDVFAVGEGGAIEHFDGATWSPMGRATTSRLWAVWGSSPTDVFAVGYDGTIVHYDGSAWSTMSSGTSEQLREVWGSSRSDVFAAGTNGAILHFDGNAWAQMNPGTTGWIRGVWGTSPTDVFASVISNQLLHWNGSTWTEVANGQDVGRMWGSSGQDVYLLGDDIKRYDGATLSAVPGTAIPEHSGNLLALWGSPDGAVFVFGGVEGLVRRGYRGATVTVTPATPTITALGATQQMTATAFSGSTPITGVTGWTWSSSDAGKVSVNPATGVVTAVANGSATITATAPGGVNGSTTVTVADPFAADTSYQGYVTTMYSGLATSNPSIPGLDDVASQYLGTLWRLEELPSDEAVIGWNDVGLPDLNTQTWTSSNPYVLAMYDRIFVQVGMANEFLRQTTDALLTRRGVGPALRATIQQYRAEARFLRALSYWHGIDFFGNIPLVTENDTTGAPPAQASRAAIYAFVVSELNAVKSLLPTPGAGTYGRATTAAADMLLAKLYLNAGVYTGTPDWGDALLAAQAVISSGFSLNPVWRNNFTADNNTSPEIVFAVPQDGVTTQTYGGMTFVVHASCGGSMVAGTYGLDYCWYGARMKPEVYNLFSAGDSRASQFWTSGQTVAVTNLNDFTNGIANPKFTNRTSSGSNGSDPSFVDTDFPMFRLADAYLMYVEAFLRGGGGSQGTALSYFNALRERAFGNASHDITGAELVLDTVLAERGRELSWEAQRRTDLVRFGRFTGGSYVWAWKGGVLAGTSTGSYLNLYPLPASVLAANPNLIQNPGY